MCSLASFDGVAANEGEKGLALVSKDDQLDISESSSSNDQAEPLKGGLTGPSDRGTDPSQIAEDGDEAYAHPSLVEQRQILSEIYSQAQAESNEGDTVYVIPSLWYNKFWDVNVTNKSQIGPIDTTSICTDFDNFLLADYNTHPYLSVPEAVFKKLNEWYGLSDLSNPVKTVLIKDENGQLVTEYNRCCFRVHFLKDSIEKHNVFSAGMRAPLFFAMSRLSSIEMVVRQCLQTFGEQEKSFDLNTHCFRIWQVQESTGATKKSLLATQYVLDPLSFAEMPIKTRLQSKMFGCLIKNLKLPVIDLAVELKEVTSGEHWPSNHFYYNRLLPPRGTTGLSNLGNSCYMNSALQCLVHIPELKDYFLYGGFEDEINTQNPLGYKGLVAQAFAALIKSLFDERSSSAYAFSPREFKSIIGQQNSMFAGFLQQDSQEFLAFLLDGLHEDLNRIIEKPFVEKPELSPEDNVNDKEVIHRLASVTWDKHKLRNDSVILDLFVGLYKSTLTCPACDKKSVTFDPFSDLTLPLPVESIWTTKVRIFPNFSPPCILEVEMPKGSSYQDLKKYVAEAANMKFDDLIGAEIFNHAFYNNYESEGSSAKYLPIEDLISQSDVVAFYEVPRKPSDLVVPVLNSVLEQGFKTARCFGFPFFIALSETELGCYGMIRKRLEQRYTNWSGGFLNFPIISNENEVSLDSLSLVKQKYHSLDLSKFKIDIENCSPTSSVEKYFAIKVLSFGNTDNNSPRNNAENQNIWTPGHQVSLSSSQNMMTLMNNVIKDIYDYQNLVTTQKDEIEEFATLSYSPDGAECREKEERTKKEENSSDMDVDVDNKDGENSPQTGNGPEAGDEFPRPKLLKQFEAIVCEWNDMSMSEVFSDEREISWDRPAELKNTKLEEAKKHRQNEGERRISLSDCLKLFSKPEVLSAADSWYCPTCREHRQATKQIQLWNTPDILTIHLKRFESRHSFSDKISDVVEFPISGLDMSNHLVCEDAKQNKLYDLIAVDNHYGGLGGGHYTAFAKNPVDGKWYYFDDSRVSETSPETSVSGAAYLLFYRRRVEGSGVGTQRLKDLLASSRRQHQLKLKEFNDRQVDFYHENHSEPEEDLEIQHSFLEASEKEFEGDVPNSSICNVASLEVGHANPSTSFEENAGRRKLRLIHKGHTNSTSNSSHPNSSATSSDSSDCSEDISKKTYPAEGAPPTSPLL
ncbi:LAQU0S27e00452g1_1 [Lachancea quebecensis]|uniref:ubiquitinyl hydrolase 1 n=1 Tax=Lachancea quebecensis TaxID=1654605 RepID=A0A0P1KXQ6_9SACH|nr:LAQU0S27e00452g1_1 [Lachancea quebecensis]